MSTEKTALLPLHTVSEANQRGHWSKKADRTKELRTNTKTLLRSYLGACPGKPTRVTLTRIAPRELDDDNLTSALKAVRDGVQDWCGIDDRKLSVRYEQRKGKVREYAVEVTLAWEAP